MNRLDKAIKYVFALSLSLILSACSGSDPAKQANVNEASGDTKPVVVIPDHQMSDKKTTLGQLSNLLEMLRDAKNLEEPLSEQERADIDTMLSQMKSLQDDPEAVRQIEELKSTLIELKGIDGSQISFDTQLLQP